MKKYFLTIFLFLVLTSKVFAQGLGDYFDFFSQMIGKWESTYDAGHGETSIEQWNVQWAIKKHFLQIDITGQFKTEKKVTWENKMFFSIDPNIQLIGWGFYDDIMNCYINYTGQLDNDILQIKGKGKDSNDYDFTLEFKDGKLIRKWKSMEDGVAKSYEAIYEKK